jgi:hypothetical protein
MKFSPWLIALTSAALSVTASLAAETAAPQGHAFAPAHGAGKGGDVHHPGAPGTHGVGVVPKVIVPPGGRPAHGVHVGKDTARGVGPAASGDNAQRGVGPAMSGNSTGGIAAKSPIKGAGLQGKDRGALATPGRAGHGAQVSGTGMAPKGVGPPTIGAAAKPHSVINGTAFAPK